MPAELKAQLEDAARKSGRSVTAEIVFRLYQTFAAPAEGDRQEEYAEIMRSLEGRDLNDYAVRNRPLRMPPEDLIQHHVQRLQEIVRGLTSADFDRNDSPRRLGIKESLEVLQRVTAELQASHPDEPRVHAIAARIAELYDSLRDLAPADGKSP